nr:hypothetical protein [Spirochaetaceae bacterium]
MKYLKYLLYLILSLSFLSCNVKKGDDIDYLIGVSNSSMLEQWRLKLNAELQEAADLYPNLSTVFTDAASSPD